MGRHTKLDEQATWVTADTDPGGRPLIVPAQVSRARRMAWIGRTPLMPVLAGIGAVGVIAAAFSTQQISLNFSNSPGTDSAVLADPRIRQAEPQAVPTSGAGGGPVKAGKWRFKTEGASGAFVGSVVIANTGGAPVDRWKLRFRIPNAAVTTARGAVLRTGGRAGGDVYLSGTTRIAPGSKIVIRFTGKGAWSKPAFCKINGVSCR
ncbi:hypothetical protein GCM10027589_56880 [Actinocorallia lasiicapitis]